jgi:hypothetical protein
MTNKNAYTEMFCYNRVWLYTFPSLFAGVFLKKFQPANAKTSGVILKTCNKTADNEGKNIKQANFSLQIVETSDTKTANNVISLKNL